MSQHEERVAYLIDRIERTQEEVTEAAAELKEQEGKLAEAIAAAEQDPSDASVRAATMESIRYNRSDAKIERLQERLDSAQDELDSIKVHQTELKQRLLVLTAQEQKAKAAAQAATAKPEPAPVKAEVTPKVAAPTQAPAPVVEPPIATAASWPSPQDESAANASFAKQILTGLAAKPAGTAPLNNVKLYHNRGRGSETFEYLGDNLYRVNMKLEAGMWGFKIYNQTFWMSVPKEMADQNFVLIYDVQGQATLHVFRASLLN